MDLFGYNSYGYNSGTNVLVGMIICIVLAFAGGIVLYCTFLSKKNNGKFTGFLGWLYDTLTFNSLLMELLLKICYLITAGFITLYSIVLLFTPGAGFVTFLLLLIGGNIGFRIIYEFMLILIIICRNTSEINKNLSGPNKTSSGPSFGVAEFKQAPPAQPQYPQYPQQPNAQQQAPAYQPPAYQPPVQPQAADAQPAPAQSIFCPECGTKLEPGTVFCPNCGAQVNQ